MTLAEFGGEVGDVEDPFGQSQDIYTKTAEQIVEYIRKGIELHK